MLRWMRGPELDRRRERDPFDPVVEGARHQLSPEVALALWQRVCAEATDAGGRRDEDRARRRFHELAARLAAGGGWLRPEVGRTTRVAFELDAGAPRASGSGAFAIRAPGRETRVAAEARWWAHAMAEPAAAEDDAAPADELPGAGDVARALAALQPAVAEPTVRLDTSLGMRMSRLFDFDLTGVEVQPASPAVTGATKAITEDGVVRFRAGAYQPGTPEGDWLIAHELAHVVQQRGGRGERTGSRAELEREADRAATLAARGQRASIALRATGAAYAFSEDDEHDREAGAADHEARDDGKAVIEDTDGSGDAGANDREGTADADAPEAAARDAEAGDADARDAEPDDAEDERGQRPPPAQAAATGGEGPGHADAATDGDAGDARPVDLKAELAAASAPVPGEGGGGESTPGGGGGAPARPQKTVASVAAARPEVGLGQLQGVRPDKLGPLLGQVHTATGTDVGKQRAAHQANPPRQMSTGAPASPKAAKAKAAAPGDHTPKNVPDAPDHPVKCEVPGGEAAKQAKQGEAAAQQKSAGQVIAGVARSIASFFGSWHGGAADANDASAAKMSDSETQQMSSSIDRLPTSASDISTSAGPAPEIAMKGEARDTSDKDRADLEARTGELETQGGADSRVPMGEDHIDTTVATEELAAAPPAAGALPDAALPTVAGAASSEEVGVVAQEQHGAEIDAALARASADVTTERASQARAEDQARAEADTQIRDLKTRSDADQAAARTAAQAEVQTARGQWQGEIDKKGADARKQADKKVAEGMAQVDAEETRANAEARQHIEDGQRKAEDEKQKGEKEAADAKDKGKQKSSGFLGWLSSKAKALVDGIKQAVSAAIDACRRAVKAVIDAAKKLAMAAIELARKAIVAAIQAIGKALIAISDVLLAAFPELKAKFQNAIRKAVDKAVDAVNKLADGLKQAVQKALDLLGAALDKALQLLAKGIDFIIDVAGAVVQAAIQAAQAVVDALGTWVKLIKDVAAGPGAWIGKLGAAVVDGIKHHLWSAFKTAVVEWFKSKVMELIGVGGLLLEILLEGGITKDEIVKMALDALIVAIPIALVLVLVEKLVSMIVPAAGALMTIIEGLRAAWGTISRIIAAFGAFMAFLLAVKGGGAGALFAAALAAAAVVVLDFIANWLLRKLAGPARKVGDRLKGMAAKFKNRKGPRTPGTHDRGGPPSKPTHHDDHDAPGAPHPHDRPGARTQPHDHDGPGGRPRHHDDHDPKRRKDRDRDKRKDRDRDDRIAARRAADAAARRGWAQARSRGSREILSAAELRSILARAASSPGKARVTLKPQDRGDSWVVHAEAVVGRSRATATAGHGWIARGAAGQPFYAAENLSSFNRKLIHDAFAELTRHDDKQQPTVRKAYDTMTAKAQSVHRKQQAALEGRLRGMKFDIDIEPFAGAEKDEKATTKITVTPNESSESRQLPLDVEAFAKRFQVAPPTAQTRVQQVAHASIHLAPPPRPPMLGNEKLSGYAINMAAIPSEVKADMATRYTRTVNGAWEGSALKDFAKLRTAVVVGVNKYRSIDPRLESQTLRAIDAGINKVRYPAHSMMAVFGFWWEPHWTEEGATTTLDKVRAAWEELPSAAKRAQALEATEDKVKTQRNLPYGIIRNQVVDTHGADAARALAQVTNPVHILIQDSDGGVQALDMGVLAAYDEVLHGLARHPLMVIGGYRFRGFDWDDQAGARTAQLTELANEIDRAIRAAVATLAPEGVYPTEPNLLIKGIDAEHGDGYYDRGLRGGFGVGPAEGRTMRETVRGADAASGNPHPAPITYAPSTSTVTSPVPTSRERGLTVFEDSVERGRTGALYAEVAGTDDPARIAANSHPGVALEMQRQSYLNPRTLEREVGIGTGLRDPELERHVYSHVAHTERALSDPHVTPEQRRALVAQHRQGVDDSVDRLGQERRYQRSEERRRKLEQARQIAHAIIRAMDGDQLKATWSELQRIFRELEDESRER